MNKSLKAIALLKVVRGCIAIGVGVTLVLTAQNSEAFIWADHSTLKQISERDPFLQQLVEYLSEFSQTEVLGIGLLTFALGILRWVEAGGIWKNKSWAQWVAVLTAFIYIPFEISLLSTKFSWVTTLILIINLLIVIYLLHILYKKGPAKTS